MGQAPFAGLTLAPDGEDELQRNTAAILQALFVERDGTLVRGPSNAELIGTSAYIPFTEANHRAEPSRATTARTQPSARAASAGNHQRVRKHRLPVSADRSAPLSHPLAACAP